MGDKRADLQVLAPSVILHSVQNDGIRDKKRRETKRRIIDEAVRLVQANGYGSVTVEDICQAAEISRRTFFNYMDSKDEAVLGVFPFVFTPASLERIRTTPTGNMIDLIVTSLETVEDAYGPNQETRQRMLDNNPELLHAEAARKRGMLTDLGRAVGDHLEHFPADRVTDWEVQEETHMIVGLFSTAMARYLWNPSTHEDPLEGLRHTAQRITTYTKELQW